VFERGLTPYERVTGRAIRHVTLSGGLRAPITAVALVAASLASSAPAGELRIVRPNLRLTPGAFNPAVRQTTIDSTICVSGWTREVRPPESYTEQLKLKQIREYRESGPPRTYEEDHFIPLELGGAPRDPHNLWPEPRGQARRSDPLESRLKREVCDGAITLARGRAEIRAFKDTHG